MTALVTGSILIGGCSLVVTRKEFNDYKKSQDVRFQGHHDVIIKSVKEATQQTQYEHRQIGRGMEYLNSDVDNLKERILKLEKKGGKPK